MEVKEGKERFSAKAPAKEYFVHDNGGRPFKVVLSAQTIDVYKMPPDFDDRLATELWRLPIGHPACSAAYSHHVLAIPKYCGVFVGNDDGSEQFKGNSVLVHTKSAKNKNEYICIGWNIFKFETADPIVSYFSRVGNSDVPYPYAVSKSTVYLMMDYMCIDKAALLEINPDMFEDVYQFFYDKNYKDLFKKYKKQELVKRIY